MLNYYMPTRIMWGREIVKESGHHMKGLGQKALIVTGRNSSKINGSLEDVLQTLSKNDIEYKIYDQILENPSIENVEEGAAYYLDADFVIGIGGGSPIDAAKAIAVLIKNKGLSAKEAFWSGVQRQAIPVVAIPTTAGTGTETTPYAILTDHIDQTKKNFSQLVFPVFAFFDVRYFMTMPLETRIYTGVDALTHLVESYLTTNSNPLNSYFSEEGLRLWGQCRNLLNQVIMDEATMEKLMEASMLAGIAIAQTGTSLPHGMGYALTYFEHIVHGKANGILLKPYMAKCKDVAKVKRILELIDFESLDSLGNYLLEVLGSTKIQKEAIVQYAKAMMSNSLKLKNHPDVVTEDDLIQIYSEYLL